MGEPAVFPADAMLNRNRGAALQTRAAAHRELPIGVIRFVSLPERLPHAAGKITTDCSTRRPVWQSSPRLSR